MRASPPRRPSAPARRRRAGLTAGLGLLGLAACDDGPAGPLDIGEVTPNPLAGVALYAAPASHAARQAEAWRATRPADAALMEKIAAQPQARWFGHGVVDVEGEVRRYVGAAAAAGRVPVLVVYNVPRRDCEGPSGDTGVTPDAYRRFVSAVAEGVGSSRAIVVLEPDALALLDCLDAAATATRFGLLREAVGLLKASGSAHVYIDAGHALWHPPGVTAERLERAGVGAADGFALNVSNFVGTDENVGYGRDVSGRLGGVRFVIDTGRNGLGPAPDLAWCNPDGRALGSPPTTDTGVRGVDAFLWVKRPGESDGPCNGGPPAGVWWPEYALGLARRAAW